MNRRSFLARSVAAVVAAPVAAVAAPAVVEAVAAIEAGGLVEHVGSSIWLVQWGGNHVQLWPSPRSLAVR